MTTYAQVLLKTELIINLAEQFGFHEAVKIHYDLPYENEEKIRLRFIVVPARNDLSYKNHNLLAAKLSAELDCDVSIIDQKSIDNLYTYDYDRKSALITNKKAVKEIIYKINNGIANEDKINDDEVNSINLDEIACKKIESEYDQSLQRIILKHADEYLKESTMPQNFNISNEQHYGNLFLSQQKKHKSAKDSTETNPLKENTVETSTITHNIHKN